MLATEPTTKPRTCASFTKCALARYLDHVAGTTRRRCTGWAGPSPTTPMRWRGDYSCRRAHMASVLRRVRCYAAARPPGSRESIGETAPQAPETSRFSGCAGALSPRTNVRPLADGWQSMTIVSARGARSRAFAGLQSRSAARRKANERRLGDIAAGGITFELIHRHPAERRPQRLGPHVRCAVYKITEGPERLGRRTCRPRSTRNFRRRLSVRADTAMAATSRRCWQTVRRTPWSGIGAKSPKISASSERGTRLGPRGLACDATAHVQPVITRSYRRSSVRRPNEISIEISMVPRATELTVIGQRRRWDQTAASNMRDQGQHVPAAPQHLSAYDLERITDVSTPREGPRPRAATAPLTRYSPRRPHVFRCVPYSRSTHPNSVQSHVPDDRPTSTHTTRDATRIGWRRLDVRPALCRACFRHRPAAASGHV